MVWQGFGWFWRVYELSKISPASKTACRGFKSFCPCQKSQVSLLRYLTFSLVCGRIWQRGTAAPCAVRVEGRVRASGTQATSRPSRQARQVRPSISIMLWRSCSPFFKSTLVFSPGFTRPQPPPSPPAPKTHPVSPFSGFSGYVSLFLSSFDPQNFRAVFCASCRIAFTS